LRGKRRNQAPALALAGLSGVLLLAAAYVVAAEAGPYLSVGEGLSDRLQALESDRPAVMSRDARKIVLDTCTGLTTTVAGLLLRTETRRAEADWCAGRAADFAESAPTAGYAWYVAAQLAADRHDQTAFADDLGRAYATAPTEQWLAERRVALAETHLAELTPDLLASHQRDLALLVQSARGVAAIARRYVAEPDFRNRIAAIVATLPNADQARFVATIRAQIAAGQTR
jgi:hypothetical protein